MGHKRKSVFKPGKYFVLRCPLLTVDTFVGLGEDLECAILLDVASNIEEARAAYRADIEKARNRLRAVVTRPEFREALAVSSKSIVEALQFWLDDPDSPSGRSAERGLMKYATRAAMRATPFGLMAGITYGSIGRAETNIRLGSASSHRRHVRGDSRAVYRIANLLNIDPALKELHRYVVNSSLYKSGDRYKYYESNTGMAFGSGKTLVNVRGGLVLDKVIRCARRFTTWDELVDIVCSCDASIEVEDAEEFLKEAISTQILISDAYPCPTGDEMADSLLSLIRQRYPQHPLEEATLALTEINQRLKTVPIGEGQEVLHEGGGQYRDATDSFLHKLDRAGVKTDNLSKTAEPENEDSEYNEDLVENNEILKTDIDEIDTASDDEELQSCYQVDMVLNTESCTVRREDLSPILNAASALYRLNCHSPANPFKDFAEKFNHRYEGLWVPLSEVLDPDTGIRFGNLAARQKQPAPLLLLPIGSARPGDDNNESSINNWIARLLIDTIKKGEIEIHLTREQIERQLPLEGALPPAIAMHAFARLQSRTIETGADKPLRKPSHQWHLIRCDGAHTLTMTGRFSHVLGDEFTHLLREDAAREQRLQPEVLFEVAYWPPLKMANLIQHPKFREYSVSYLAPPIKDSDGNIELEDLLVTIDGSRVRLKSRSLGIEILPRFDHAMNMGHHTGTIVTNFLAMLQYQNALFHIEWTWGGLRGLPELPRVVIDDVIVAPRTWNIGSETVDVLTAHLGKSRSQHENFESFRAVQKWKKENDIPRYIAVGNATDYLAVDLDNPLSIELFLRSIRRTSTFFEQPEAHYGGGINKMNGSFVNEFVIPLWSSAAKEHDNSFLNRDIRVVSDLRIGPAASQSATYRTTREGVYYCKIYSGSGNLDQLLRDDISELTHNLTQRGVIDSWFFIRYSDPNTHIRLRFSGQPDQLRNEVIPAIEAVMAQKIEYGVTQVHSDYYQPEYDRYGGPMGLAISEQIFHQDSIMVLDLLSAATISSDDEELRKIYGPENRWKIAAYSCDNILRAWGLDFDQKLELIQHYRDALSTPYGLSGDHYKMIGQFYRSNSDQLVDILGDGNSKAVPNSIRHALIANIPGMQKLFKTLQEAGNRGALTRAPKEILLSHIHMHCNRTFIAGQRQQEAMLLQLMVKTYLELKHSQ